MPFKYDKHYETEEELKENYYKEGHYRMPPGCESPGYDLRRKAAIVRKNRLTELEMQERTRYNPMTFTVDMNSEESVKCYLNILQSRLKYLEDNPIIVPTPTQFV